MTPSFADFDHVRVPQGDVRSPRVHIRRGKSRRTLCGLSSPEGLGSVAAAPTCGRCIFRESALLAPGTESALEVEAARLIAAAGLPTPVRQYPLGEEIGRRWRMDFAWPAQRVALEVDGGGIIHRKLADGRIVMVPGRHNSDDGREDDAVRDAFALLTGWLVFRATPRLLREGYALRWIASAIQYRVVQAACGDVVPPPLQPERAFPTAAMLRPKQHARKLAAARARRIRG